VCVLCVCGVCMVCVFGVCVWLVCVCVAKFRDPTAFMKLNLDAVTRHALFRLQQRLHKRPFAIADACSKPFNTHTTC